MQVPFYSPELSRESLSPSTESQQAGDNLKALLCDEQLKDLVQSGDITLAMIRPGLGEATNIEGADNEIAGTIEGQIGNLGVLAKFAVQFTDTEIEEFYWGEPRDVQLDLPPERLFVFASRWEEFKALMTSGPTTVLLLHDNDHQAITKWRQQVGHWNIKENRDPSTIRGRLGVDNYNNLIHGSDSPESVLREIGIISRLITAGQDRQ